MNLTALSVRWHGLHALTQTPPPAWPQGFSHAGARSAVARAATTQHDPRQQATKGSSEQTEQLDIVFGNEVMYSGLQGKALESGKYWPTKQEVFDVIPKHCLKRDTTKSMGYAALSLAMTAACGWAGTFIPALPNWAPAWLAYGAITGAASARCALHPAQWASCGDMQHVCWQLR